MTISELASEANLSKERLRVWLGLLKVTSRIEAEIRSRLRDEHKTTLPRFDVMAALARHPEGLKMSDLSTYLRVSNGNVTGIVDRLTEDGLATRIAVKGDRRAQLARLTPAGTEVFAKLAKEHEAWIDTLLGGLGPDELRAVKDLMAVVAAEDEDL